MNKVKKLSSSKHLIGFAHNNQGDYKFNNSTKYPIFHNWKPFKEASQGD